MASLAQIYTVQDRGLNSFCLHSNRGPLGQAKSAGLQTDCEVESQTWLQEREIENIFPSDGASREHSLPLGHASQNTSSQLSDAGMDENTPEVKLSMIRDETTVKKASLSVPVISDDETLLKLPVNKDETILQTLLDNPVKCAYLSLPVISDDETLRKLPVTNTLASLTAENSLQRPESCAQNTFHSTPVVPASSGNTLLKVPVTGSNCSLGSLSSAKDNLELSVSNTQVSLSVAQVVTAQDIMANIPVTCTNASQGSGTATLEISASSLTTTEDEKVMPALRLTDNLHPLCSPEKPDNVINDPPASDNRYITHDVINSSGDISTNVTNRSRVEAETVDNAYVTNMPNEILGLPGDMNLSNNVRKYRIMNTSNDLTNVRNDITGTETRGVSREPASLTRAADGTNIHSAEYTTSGMKIGNVRHLHLADKMHVTYVDQMVYVTGSSAFQSPEADQIPYFTPVAAPSDLQTGDEKANIRAPPRSAKRAPQFEEAVKILQDKGLVFVCGPPASGKTYLCEQLVHYFTDQGFVITSLHKLSAHQRRGRYFLWLDGDLGEVKVNPDQLRRLSDFVNNIHLNPELYGQLLVLVTVYPHVLREMQKFCSEKLLPKDESTVLWLTQDPTNPGLTFTPTLETYRPLFQHMIHDQLTGNKMAALLVLSMLGQGNFLNEPRHVYEELERLGLKASCGELERMAFVLKGSVLNAGRPGFLDRTLYNTAGLVLGHSIYLPVLLKVCDAQFLVEFVHVDDSLNLVANDKTVDQNRIVVITSPDDRWLLVQTMHQQIVSGKLQQLCQHSSFRNPEFLEDIHQLCQKKRKKKMLHQLAKAEDNVSHLPLLYWSVWSSSPALRQWCLRLELEHCAGKKNRQTNVILSTAFATALLPHNRPIGLDVKTSTRDFLNDLLSFKFKASTEEKLTLKLPTPTEGFSETDKDKMKAGIKKLQSRNLCYLDDRSLPIPASLLDVTVTEEGVSVEIADRQWYLALRLLSDQKVDEIDPNGDTALHVAIEAQNQDAIELVVKSGASLTLKNNDGLTPYDMWEKLAKKKKDRIKCISKLHTSCKSGSMDDVRLLLCTSGTVHDKHEGNTPLHVACREGHSQIAELLLQLGSNVNAVNMFQVTPLHVACRAGHLDTCRLLVQHGGDVHQRASCRNMALHLACMKGHTDVAAFLLQQNADVNATGHRGFTALHEACVQNHQRVITLLLDHRANINHRDGFGETPLHLAIKGKHPLSLMTLLLQRGADVNVKNNKGWSALELARSSGVHMQMNMLIYQTSALNTVN